MVPSHYDGYMGSIIYTCQFGDLNQVLGTAGNGLPRTNRLSVLRNNCWQHETQEQGKKYKAYDQLFNVKYQNL